MSIHFVHPTAKLGKDCHIGHFAVIHEQVEVGEGSWIGDHVVILPGTKIGAGAQIGAGSVIGRQPSSNMRMKRKNKELPPLVLGERIRIGACAVLYAGSKLGDDMFIGDHASIRENVTIGGNTIIGRAATIELNTTIGSGVVLQTNSYITGDTHIEDGVFIGPCVSMSNDKYMGTRPFSYQGPWIREGAAIGNNTTLLPGVEIGRQAVVGGGCVVTKDVPDHDVVVGNPARSLKRKEE